MKLLILNGPNLNMLGIREPEHYGKTTYNDLVNLIDNHANEKGISCETYQTNSEGGLVDKIQQAYFDKVDGIVINPGAYTHTSIAILDAVKSVQIPCVEVHISKVEEREEFRQTSYIRLACVKTITGQGVNGYLQAIDFLINYLNNGRSEA
ncbi:MAG: type II 3-dehydroquinate dehydratase [Clostridia bacterium]|nr:type II 3-dehydroquinate dehydratase [Clostridia bacterium]